MNDQQEAPSGLPTGIPLSYQRVAQLADLRMQQCPQAGTWGVWCLHERRWVQVVDIRAGGVRLAEPAGAEREAWRLLIETPSAHPWELRIARADDEGLPIFPGRKKSKPEPCHHCGGSGNCTRCDGRGKEPEG